MARAETMETTGGGGGGGDYHAPLPRHHTCGMEMPRPMQSWPMQTATTTTLLHLQPQPLQDVQLPSTSPPPAGVELQVGPRARPSPRPRLCSLVEDGAEEQGGEGEDTPSASATEGSTRRERTDSEREDDQQSSSPRAPLPDLLPQREHSGWASPPHRAPGGESGLEGEEIRRVAHQLRTIGDNLNATLLQRAEAVAPWQDWTGVCRGLVAFLAETFNSLHRLT